MASPHFSLNVSSSQTKGSLGNCRPIISSSFANFDWIPLKIYISIPSRISTTSSYDSSIVISRSRPVNSVRWRLVKDNSARKTGPTSNTLSKSAAIAICLASCGLCARYAFPDQCNHVNHTLRSGPGDSSTFKIRDLENGSTTFCCGCLKFRRMYFYETLRL